MAITTEPLTYPPTLNKDLAQDGFGIKITGGFGDINNLTKDEFSE